MSRLDLKTRRRRSLRQSGKITIEAIKATTTIEGAQEYLVAQEKKAEDQVGFSPDVWIVIIQLAIKLLPLLFEWKQSFAIANKIRWVMLSERMLQEVLFNCEHGNEVAQDAMAEAEMRGQAKESAVYAYILQNWSTLEGT